MTSDQLVAFLHKLVRDAMHSMEDASRLTVIAGPAGTGKSHMTRLVVPRILHDLHDDLATAVWLFHSNVALDNAQHELRKVDPDNIIERLTYRTLKHDDDHGAYLYINSLLRRVNPDARTRHMLTTHASALKAAERLTQRGNSPVIFVWDELQYLPCHGAMSPAMIKHEYPSAVQIYIGDSVQCSLPNPAHSFWSFLLGTDSPNFFALVCETISSIPQMKCDARTCKG